MWPGVLLALLTSLSWALANVLIQRSTRAIGVGRALFWAMVVGGVLASIGAVVFESPAWAHVGLSSLLALGGAILTGLFAYVGMFYAFENAPLSVAVPVVSSWALVSALLSIVVLGEVVTWNQAGAALLVFVGVVVVSLNPGSPSDGQVGKASPKRGRLPMVGALAGALGFGLMIPCLAEAAKTFGPLTTAALTYAGLSLLGLPVAMGLGVSLRPPGRGVWPAVAGTGAAEAIGLIAVSLAPAFAPVTVVAPLASLAATFTVLFAWLFLGEKQGPVVVVGTALVCLGVVALSL